MSKSYHENSSAQAPILPAPHPVPAADFLALLDNGTDAPVCARLLPAKVSPKITSEDCLPYKDTHGGHAYLAAQRAIYGAHGLSTFPESATSPLSDWAADGAAHISALKANQRDGRGVYFAPNGAHETATATRVAAFFAETDGVAREAQYARVMALPVPPQVIIATRNSLHCYWLAAAGVNIDHWRTVQRTLVRALESDASITKPAQLMRLPGFDHVTLNRATQTVERVPVSVIRFEPDAARLTAAQMLGILAAAGAEPFADNLGWREYLRERTGTLAGASPGRGGKTAHAMSGATRPALPDADLGETFNSLLGRLEIVGQGGHENEVRTICPACGDGSPSLMVRLTEDKILLNCYGSPCSTEAVCAALGVREYQLFARDPKDAELYVKHTKISGNIYPVCNNG